MGDRNSLSMFKKRGFNFEETHITKPERVSRIVAVLSLAFVWAVKVGHWCHENIKALKVKKHGRLEKSYFRYGLDVLDETLLGKRFQDYWSIFLGLLKPT